MQTAGVPLLAGSDAANPYTYPGFSLHDELEEMVAAGLTTAEVLRIATLVPAEFLEATDSLGTIAPGKVADIVLLCANPLLDIKNVRLIEAVVTRGRLLNRSDLDSMLADVAIRVK
jgi:imidazolonepropionase-like amidohydrolase